jgi:hypothetical protein
MPLVVLMFALLTMSACSKDMDKTESKPAETAERPKMAGGTFSSDLPLQVFVIREAGEKQELIGETPSARPLDMPPCASWGVYALNRVDMKALAREIEAKKIPHLRIVRWAIDGDLAHLKGLTELRELDLGRIETLV